MTAMAVGSQCAHQDEAVALGAGELLSLSGAKGWSHVGHTAVVGLGGEFRGDVAGVADHNFGFVNVHLKPRGSEDVDEEV